MSNTNDNLRAVGGSPSKGSAGGANPKKSGPTSKDTTAREYLGTCPECKMSFRSKAFAMPCSICKKNYHHHCLNKLMSESERDEGMVKGIRSIRGNIICNRCETTALRAIEETKLNNVQTRKLNEKIRATENTLEQNRVEAQQRIDLLTEQINQAHAQPATTPEMLNEFEELKGTYETSRQRMEKKYNELYAHLQKEKETAQSTIQGKESLAQQAIAEFNKVQEVVTRLTAENCNLKQTINEGHRMDVDHHTENDFKNTDHHHIYARFEELMNAQQKKLTDMMMQTVAPIKQLIIETVDSRLTTLIGSHPSHPMQEQHIIMMQNEQQASQHQALLKATDSTFAEALYTNSAKGKFSIVVPEDQKAIIDTIEQDFDLADCGRCQLVERRTPTSLAITTDEETSICIKEKLRAKYAAAEEREPDEEQKYRIKITGCKAVPGLENEEPTAAQMTEAERIFRRYNKINNEKLFKIERMWTLTGKSIKYTNYIAEVDAVMHKKILREGKISEGLAQRRVTEYIDILQCKNCWRFGHIKKTCTFPACCKICAKEHATEECNAPAVNPSCANCIRHNATTSSNVVTTHSVAADNYPIRINRIERLKIHFKAPKKQLVNLNN